MGGFSSSAFAVAAFSVAAFAFDTTTQPPPPTFTGWGGGGVYSWSNRHDRMEIEIVDHQREDEEAIVLTLLLQIARMEYF